MTTCPKCKRGTMKTIPMAPRYRKCDQCEHSDEAPAKHSPPSAKNESPSSDDDERAPTQHAATVLEGVSKMTDEQLAEIVRTQSIVLRGTAELLPTACKLAEELLHARRLLRRESRVAEQVRRCRWTLENALTKIEDIEEKLGTSESA